MRSNPVPAREEWDPIQAEESLTAAFMDTALSGRWILRFRDTTMKEVATGIGRAAVRDKHGDGGIAGWEVNTLSRIFTAQLTPYFEVCVMDGLELVPACITRFCFVTTRLDFQGNQLL